VNALKRFVSARARISGAVGVSSMGAGVYPATRGGANPGGRALTGNREARAEPGLVRWIVGWRLPLARRRG
jgi:hypothetical protein